MRDKKTNCCNFHETYRNDNFEAFEKLLIKSKGRPFVWRTTNESKKQFNFNVLEDILSSNSAKSPKYVSLILMHYNLFADEEFLSTVNQEGKFMMHYVLKSGSAENLLTFLVPDWFDHRSSYEKDCALVCKARQFEEETKTSFLRKLCEMIDDEHNQVYKDVCLRILCQYMSELENQQQASDLTCDFLSVKNIMEMTNNEYREKIFQILMVFWNVSDSEFKKTVTSYEKSEESKYFFKSAFLLKERQIGKFQESFEIFLNYAEKTYVDYSEVRIKAKVRLLHEISKRQKLWKTCNFIMEKFPFIDKNSTLMSIFYDVRYLNIFNIAPLQNQKLNKLVKIFEASVAQSSEIFIVYS